MDGFQKFFGGVPKPNEPDNSRLLHLLDIYWKAGGEGDSYEKVVLELMNGNSFLMLPGPNEVNREPGGWITTKEAMTLKLSSLYTLDGLRVLAAFTDENALLDWSKQSGPYFSMRSQDVLKMCEASDIPRVVINNNSSNMFVLEKSRKDTREYTIQANSKLLLGTPQAPLDRVLLDKMIARFRRLDNISRVYQFGQTKGKEFSLVLGFELVRGSENGKKAVIDLVREVIGNEELPLPLDILFIETEEWRRQISAIEGSFIYEN